LSPFAGTSRIRFDGCDLSRGRGTPVCSVEQCRQANTPQLRTVRTLLAAGTIALACTALLGIQQTVAVALRQTPGGATTMITLGIAALGVWAISVLREE
jgi:hypothetical protein